MQHHDTFDNIAVSWRNSAPVHMSTSSSQYPARWPATSNVNVGWTEDSDHSYPVCITRTCTLWRVLWCLRLQQGSRIRHESVFVEQVMGLMCLMNYSWDTDSLVTIGGAVHRIKRPCSFGVSRCLLLYSPAYAGVVQRYIFLPDFKGQSFVFKIWYGWRHLFSASALPGACSVDSFWCWEWGRMWVLQ